MNSFMKKYEIFTIWIYDFEKLVQIIYEKLMVLGWRIFPKKYEKNMDILGGPGMGIPICSKTVLWEMITDYPLLQLLRF